MFRYSVRTQKEQNAENLVKHSDVWWKPSLLENFLQARLDKPGDSIICPHAADGTDSYLVQDNLNSAQRNNSNWQQHYERRARAGTKQKRKSRDSGRQNTRVISNNTEHAISFWSMCNRTETQRRYHPKDHKLKVNRIEKAIRKKEEDFKRLLTHLEMNSLGLWCLGRCIPQFHSILGNSVLVNSPTAADMEIQTACVLFSNNIRKFSPPVFTVCFGCVSSFQSAFGFPLCFAARFPHMTMLKTVYPARFLFLLCKPPPSC